MNKNKIAIVMIVVILVITFFIKIKDLEQDDKQGPIIDDIHDLIDESKEVDITEAILRLEDEANSFKHKDSNYSIMNFFYNVNRGEFNNINIYPECVEFLSLSDSYLKDKYDVGSNLIYQIIDVKKSDNKYIYDIKYKDEDSGAVKSRTFSSDGVYIIDEPFIKVEPMNENVDDDDLSIKIESKAIFEKYTIYKIGVFNKTNKEISIKSDMYGFYGTNGINKYSHELLGADSLSYQLYPGLENVLYVKFKTTEKIKIFLNTDKGEIRLM